MKTILRAALLGICFFILTNVQSLAYMAAATTEQNEPTAEEIMAAATGLLKNLPQFSFEADITEDVLTDGDVMIQTAHRMTYRAKRPDKLYYKIEGDDLNKEMYYDGKNASVYDLERNFYASVAFPPTLDEALIKAHNEYNVRMAIVGMARSDWYANLTRNVKESRVIGVSRINGQECYQILLVRERVNVQLWIQTGKLNLLRKMLITYKQYPGSPQWSAIITRWNIEPNLADSSFHFKPREGASSIPFIRNERPTE